jgi:putative intracellular protease/amidase
MRSDTALLWDESYLWGVMTYDALRRLGLGFRLVSSSDVRNGCLSEHRAVFVPGGWASNKMKSLGDDGIKTIRDFVSSGGTYIGLCGGAGLATSDGIGLINVKRKPLGQRVPSVSGKVSLSLSEHPIWEGVDVPLFDIWWPSQFVVEDERLRVLASFDKATPGAFSSDFCVGDMDTSKWEDAEKSYGINLDPAKMAGDPMVVEGTYGKGRVLTSLVHFDTPGSRNGETLLKNIWGYLGLAEASYSVKCLCGPGRKLYEKAEEIFSFGERNFLWFRNGPLLQWRRGIRGLEYFTLYRIAAEIACRIGDGSEGLNELEGKMKTFMDKSLELLALERNALRRGERITFAETQDSAIKALREELFSRSKSYGGFFKELLGGMDSLLFRLLRGEMEEGKEVSGKNTRAYFL